MYVYWCGGIKANQTIYIIHDTEQLFFFVRELKCEIVFFCEGMKIQLSTHIYLVSGFQYHCVLISIDSQENSGDPKMA